LSQKTLFGDIAEQSKEEKGELRHARIVVETIKEERYEHSVFHVPYWMIDYRCDGCTSHCGGGQCCQTPEEMDKALAHYRHFLENCNHWQKGKRRIKVDVTDDHKRQAIL
jgi:hypothetical protein